MSHLRVSKRAQFRAPPPSIAGTTHNPKGRSRRGQPRGKDISVHWPELTKDSTGHWIITFPKFMAGCGYSQRCRTRLTALPKGEVIWREGGN